MRSGKWDILNKATTKYYECKVTVILPPPSLSDMKHNKEVDEYFRNLARFEQDEAYLEYIGVLARIIEPRVNRDIKR